MYIAKTIFHFLTHSLSYNWSSSLANDPLILNLCQRRFMLLLTNRSKMGENTLECRKERLSMTYDLWKMKILNLRTGQVIFTSVDLEVVDERKHVGRMNAEKRGYAWPLMTHFLGRARIPKPLLRWLARVIKPPAIRAPSTISSEVGDSFVISN